MGELMAISRSKWDSFDTLVDLKNCLESEKIPNSGDNCDNCRRYNEKKNKGL